MSLTALDRPHSRPRRIGSSALLSQLLLLAFLLLSILVGDVRAQAATVTQTIAVTASNTATGSASLNAPSRSAGATGDATVTRTAPQVTQTVIPDLDLSGAQVPFLLQKPIPSEYNELRNKVTSRMKDVYFTGCPSDQVDYVDSSLRINISAVYVQFDPSLERTRVLAPENSYSSGVLRIVAVGATDSQGKTANSLVSPPLLSTLSVETQFLTFDVFRNSSYLCDSLYPTTPDPNGTLIIPPGCLYGPGQVSLGIGIPLNDTYTLGTLWTRIRLSDTSSPPLDIACIEVYASPYNSHKWYWHLILWFPIALTIGYFVIISLARVLAVANSRAKAFKNKAREGSQPNIIKDTVGPTLIASLSGQKLNLSAALLRFSTPGCWDIILHTQFVAAVSMMAVRWPAFSYAFFKQAAWATLVGNVTIIRPEELDSQFDLLQTGARLPTGTIESQFANTSTPLYMNEAEPNHLMNLDGARAGMEAFARVVGLRSQDLFGTCLSIWFIIVAAIVLVSFVAWLLDSFHDTFRRLQKRREDGGYSVGLSNGADTAHDNKEVMDNDDDQPRSSLSRRGGYRFLGAGRTRTIGASNNTIHLEMLHGNIVRAVLLFHLPITIFTTYQMANADRFSATSVGLAGLAFAFFSIIIPTYLVFRISRAPTAKLYDSIGTLSAYGPLYNTYSPGSQLFCLVDFAHTFILGVVIGAAQASGSAQAIIVLVVEVMFALACSLWLPWGEGAMMGPISFVANVLRIITAVLVLLLSPVVDFGREPIGWLTYVILLIQAILYVCAALILLVKIVEGLVRIFGRASFDERSSSRTSGLGGAIRKIRRRKETLQLGKGGKDGGKAAVARANRSSSINTQAMMLANNGGKASSTGNNTAAGTPAPGSPRLMNSSLPSAMSRMPLHSRQASYASYLDSQFYGRKSPAEMLADGNSPYSTYLRGDPNDEGFIMAALPPNVVNGRAVSPPPQQQGQQQQPQQQQQQHWNGRQSPPSSSSGFVRVGGGRATDAAPYQALGVTSVGGGPGTVEGRDAAVRRPRPQSQSAIIDSYHDPRRSFTNGVDDPGMMSSTAAAAHHSSVKRYSTGAQLRPTSSIAGMMAVDEEGQLLSEPAKKKGKKGFWRRGASDDSDSDDDDDDDDGTGPFRSQGGWRGLNKMSAAMGALAALLGGKSGGVAEEGDNSLEPPSSETGGAARSSGFEVVRPQRPRPTSSPAAEHALDSTALAAATAATSRSPTQAMSNSYPMPAYEAASLPSQQASQQQLMQQRQFAERAGLPADFDPSSGTLPPGAAEQAPLLPQHSASRAYPNQNAPVKMQASSSSAPTAKMDEDMFWVSSSSSSRPESQQSGTRRSPQPMQGQHQHQRSGSSLALGSTTMAASGPVTRDTRQQVSSASSRSRIVEPMQAELVSAEDSEGSTPPAVPVSTAPVTPAMSRGTTSDQLFFDAEGNLNPEAVSFDRRASGGVAQTHPDPAHTLQRPAQPAVWDAARAYNS